MKQLYLVVFIFNILLQNFLVFSFDYKNMVESSASVIWMSQGILRKELFINCKATSQCKMVDTKTMAAVSPAISGASLLETFGFTVDASKLIILKEVQTNLAIVEEYSTSEKTLISTINLTLPQADPMTPTTVTQIKTSEKGKIIALDSNEGLLLYSSPQGQLLMQIPASLNQGFYGIYFFENDTKIAVIEKNSGNTSGINKQIKIYDLTTSTLLQNINLDFVPRYLFCQPSTNEIVINDNNKTYKYSLSSGKQVWAVNKAGVTFLSISEDGSRIIQQATTATSVLNSEGKEIATYTGLNNQILINEFHMIYVDISGQKLIKFQECDGFFNGSNECESCSDLFENCLTCSKTACETCQPDFVYQTSPTIGCVQCSNSIDYTLSYVDLNTIKLQFKDVFVFKQTIPTDQYLQSTCEYFFDQETLLKFGNSPKCILGEQYDAAAAKNLPILMVQFSYYSTFQENESIKINPGAFLIENCVTIIDTLSQTSITVLSTNLQSAPTAQIKLKPIYTQCEPIIMSLRDIENDAMAKLKDISWNIQYSDPLQQSSVIDINNSVLVSFNNKIKIEIPQNSLQSNTSYIINAKITNIYDKETTISKQFQVGTQQTATITILNASDKLNLKTWESFDIKFKIEQQNCITGKEIQEQQVEYNIDLMSDNTFTTVTSSLKSDNKSLVNQAYGTYTIEPYKYAPNNIYYLRFSTKLGNNLQELISYDTLILQIQESDYIAKILEGRKTVAFDKQLNLTALVQDLDVNPVDLLTSEQFILTWSCNDPAQSIACTNADGSALDLSTKTTELLTLEVGTFKSLNLYEFKLKVTKTSTGKSSEDIVTIAATDKPISDLDFSINIPKIFLLKRINPTDPIDFLIDIPQNYDTSNLQYSVLLKYDDINVGTKQFNFPQFQFIITDVFDDFKPTLEIITLQVNIYDSSKFIYYSKEFVLKINTPPTKGSIEIQPETGVALETQFEFTSYNFIDSNSPLLYKFSYFLSQNDFENMQNQIIITEFQPFSTVNSIVSSSKDKINKNQIIILVEVKDAYGSVSQNIQKLIVTPQTSSALLLTTVGSYADLVSSGNNEEFTDTSAQKYQKINILLSELVENTETLIQEEKTNLQQISNKIFQFLIKSTQDELNLQDTVTQIKPLNKILKINAQIQKSNPSQTIISTDEIFQLTEFFNNKIDNQVQKLSEVSSFYQIQDISQSEKLKSIREESQQYADIFMSGYDSLVQFILADQSRLLTQVELELSKIQQTILQIQKITKILVAPLLPNAQEVKFQGQNIKSTVNKYSYSVLKNMFTYDESFLTENYAIQLQDGEIFQEFQDNFDSNGNQNTVYNYELIEIQQNPMKKQGNFQYPNQSFPVQILSINQVQQYNSIQGLPVTLNPGNTYQIVFNHEIKSDENIVCIQYLEDQQKWSPKNCQSFQKSKLEVACQCSTFDPITIVNDTEQIYQKLTFSQTTTTIQQAEQLVEEEGDFWTSFIFFFIIFQILISIFFVTYGFTQDKKMTKINSTYDMENSIQQNIQKNQNLDDENELPQESGHKLKPRQELINDSQNEDNIQDYGTSRTLQKKRSVVKNVKQQENEEEEEQDENRPENEVRKQKKRKRTQNQQQQNPILSPSDSKHNIIQKQVSKDENDSIFNSTKKITTFKPPSSYNLDSNPKEISIAYSFFIFHQFLSISTVYRQSISRSSRYISIFAKFSVLFGLLSIIIQSGDDIGINILRTLSVIISFGISIIPLSLNLLIQTQNKALSVLGTILQILLYVGFIVLGIYQGLDMTEQQMTDLGDSYIVGLFVDIFVIQSALSVIKHLTALNYGDKQIVQTILGKEILENQYQLSFKINQVY